MRHLISLLDVSSDDVQDILALAARLKSKWRRGKRRPLLAGRVLVQVFEKPSLRTRVSFEAAMGQLGGSSIFLTSQDAGFGGRESSEDIAHVLGGYADVITLRTFSQGLIETFSQHAECSVINALSDDYHPCQALADVMTIEELCGPPAEKKLVYIGDGNNVARSLAVACGHVGMKLTIAAPASYQLKGEFVAAIQERFPALELTQSSDPQAAVQGADVIYTDVWASMGQEKEKEQRSQEFAAFQVNTALLDAASPDVRFMHCLPARLGLEVTEEVMSDPRSIVFPQAENRMHLAKGLLVWLLREDRCGKKKRCQSS